MSQILSFIFDRFTDPLGLPIDAWKECIVLAVIELFAYILSFRVVGNMYREGIIGGRTAGSILHWIIRLILFFVVWAITYFVIWLVKLIFAHWIPIVCVLGGLSVIGATTLLVIRYKKAVKKNA